MLCEHCRKREASVHIQKIVNGKVETKHYCTPCMEKLSGTEVFDGMNIAELLLKVKDAVELKGQTKAGSEVIPAVSCPGCGWDLARLVKTERCGCPECYHTFRQAVEKILKKYHTSLIHKGKVPAVAESSEPGKIDPGKLRSRIRLLRRELDFMVQKEEYEVAAGLRDEIASLTAQLSGEESKSHGKE